MPDISTLGFILFAAILALYLRTAFRKEVVQQFQAGLLYKDGRYLRTLEPGGHWLLGGSYSLNRIDMRQTVFYIQGQEVLTADNVGIKVSGSVNYRVVDAAKALHDNQSFYNALYNEVQVAIRGVIAGQPVEELLSKRLDLASQLLEIVKPKAESLGLCVESVEIKDVMFPGELKRIFTEVVRAQKEGQAMLERARGETASLRNLANAAKLLENNPALMNLRVIQSLSGSSTGAGTTLVLGLQNGFVPLHPAPPPPPQAQMKPKPPHGD